MSAPALPAAAKPPPTPTFHPVRALVEAVLAGGVLQAALWAVAAQVSDYALAQGGFFISLACGCWCAVRLGPATGTRRRRWLVPAGMTLGMGAGLGGLTLGLVFLLGEGARWSALNSDAGWGMFYLLAAGPAFLAWRGVLRGWHAWHRLRRRHMHWALTHTNLVILACGVAVVVASFILRQGTFRADPAGGPVAFGVTLLTNVILPVLSLTVLATFLALIVLLPPAALLSYTLVRRTTRRLGDLVQATTALRAGAFPAQVEVSGEDEVAQLQTGFNAMAADLGAALTDLKAERDRVAALLEGRRKLIASVSHELRTPVATLRGYVDLIMSGEEPGVAGAPNRDLVAMERELGRLETLIDDLFTLARADAGGLALQCQPADAGSIAQRAVDTMAPLAWRSARVKVTAVVPPGLPPALVDPGRLAQVLVNLLRNAVSHTSPGGIVVVEAASAGDEVTIRVTDTGEGIAADDLPHIWERFYQGAGARAGEGAGLGLAVVKDLVEGMGGSVEVQSAAGQGSCFEVHLPRS